MPSEVWGTGTFFGPDRHELVLLPPEYIPLIHITFSLLRFKVEAGNLSCQSKNLMKNKGQVANEARAAARAVPESHD